MRAPSAAARQPNDFALAFGEGWLSGIGLGARSERCGSLVNARHWPNGTAASAVLRDVAHDYTDLRPGVRLEDAGAGVRCCLGAAAGVDRRGGVGGGRPTLDPMPSHAELGLLGPSTAPIGRLHYHRIASNRTLSPSTPSCLISPQAHRCQFRVPMFPPFPAARVPVPHPHHFLLAQYFPSPLYLDPSLKLAVCIGCLLPLQSGTPVQYQPWPVFEPSPPPFGVAAELELFFGGFFLSCAHIAFQVRLHDIAL